MKKILLLLLASAPLLAQPQSIGSSGKVSLLREERINEQKQHVGYNYYAHNAGEQPAMVEVELQETENVLNGLVPGNVIVRPAQTESLGWVEQRDLSSPANWRLQWKVTEAEIQPQTP